MLNIFKNFKYKVISATMGIGLLASTGLVSVVHASPVNTGSVNAKQGVVYKTNYSPESFKDRLRSLVSSGVINNYQESKVLDIYNAGGNFKVGLDNLVARGVISGYQESRILDVFSNSIQQNNSPKSNSSAQTKVQGSTPAQQMAPVSNHR